MHLHRKMQRYPHMCMHMCMHMLHMHMYMYPQHT